MNWREFVETMSFVDQILREDPADVYVKMDFPTRDRYRHVVEKSPRKAPCRKAKWRAWQYYSPAKRALKKPARIALFMSAII